MLKAIEFKENRFKTEHHYNVGACKVTATESRLNAIIQVKNDLLGRLKEVV